MKSKKDTSPVRSRDKVLQSLYEIELSGSSAEEILKDLSLQSRYPHYKDLLMGVVDSQEDIDKTLSEFMERDMPSLDPIERNTLRHRSKSKCLDPKTKILIKKRPRIIRVNAISQGKRGAKKAIHAKEVK